MELTWLLLDNTNSPLTGGAANTSLKIRRVADGYLLDFNDGVFKNSGWITLSATFTEVDAVNLPGLYNKAVSESVWQDGLYQAVSSYHDGGVVKRHGLSDFRVKRGAHVPDLSVAEVIQALWAKFTYDKNTKVFTAYDLAGSPLVTGTVDKTASGSVRIPT